jgi:N-acetylglutamate synthase-like GNAT family acetyltransferase
MTAFQVRSTDTKDVGWIGDFLKQHWGSTKIVSRGRIHCAERLPGFVAIHDDKPVGLVTYRIDGNQCEIVTLNSLFERTGIGSALLNTVKAAAAAAKCLRIWLVTTNDNVRALHFYQRRGFVLVAVHRNAIEKSRKLKPEIPLVGFYGIPLRDEIELEMSL